MVPLRAYGIYLGDAKNWQMFFGESEEGGDDGPDAAAVNPLELENDTSSASGGLELVSAFVTGVSLFASALFFV